MGGCKIVTDQPLTIAGMMALTLNVPNRLHGSRAVDAEI
jgi:hypothetical protein